MSVSDSRMTLYYISLVQYSIEIWIVKFLIWNRSLSNHMIIFFIQTQKSKNGTKDSWRTVQLDTSLLRNSRRFMGTFSHMVMPQRLVFRDSPNGFPNFIGLNKAVNEITVWVLGRMLCVCLLNVKQMVFCFRGGWINVFIQMAI